MISRRMQIALGLLLVVLIGLGLYGLKLKRKAESVQTGAEALPVAPLDDGSSGTVTVWLPDDEAGVIRSSSLAVSLPSSSDESERAKGVLRALVAKMAENGSKHPLPPGADVHAVYLLKDNTAIIDLNLTICERHPSGVASEQMTILSLIATLSSAAPNVTRVRFMVDGKPRQTLAGHADLTDYYDVIAVMQAIKEMQ